MGEERIKASWWTFNALIHRGDYVAVLSKNQVPGQKGKQHPHQTSLESSKNEDEKTLDKRAGFGADKSEIECELPRYPRLSFTESSCRIRASFWRAKAAHRNDSRSSVEEGACGSSRSASPNALLTVFLAEVATGDKKRTR